MERRSQRRSSVRDMDTHDTYHRFKSAHAGPISAGLNPDPPRGMRTPWDDEATERGWTRREWAKLAMTAGALGSIAALGATVSGQLLPPPMKFPGELREQIYYTKWPSAAWWNARQGQPIRVTDFGEWQGATGVWRGLFFEGRWVPGTGYPALLIRVPHDAPEFQAPTGVRLPPGFDLYYDDAERRIRIVVLFDRCPHLCCPPGWHVITDTQPLRDYLSDTPTFRVYNQDPVFCVCHGSQYDPLLLVTNVNPKSGAAYVGAMHVHGPTQRALPVIPVRAVNDVLFGGMADPRWYAFC